MDEEKGRLPLPVVVEPRLPDDMIALTGADDGTVHVYKAAVLVPFTQEQYEDFLFFQELEREQKVRDWEAPFPMDQRTQMEMAQNEERIVREGIARFAAFMTSERVPFGF